MDTDITENLIRVTDLHTHLLNDMDDGPSRSEESIEILNKLKDQGADRICATSHFYATRETPEEFLARRAEAFKRIESGIPEGIDLRLGAEVLYYKGMGKTRQMEDLTIEGTDLLLTELDSDKVSEHVVKDLLDLRSRGIRPVLAHLNRYRSFYDDEFIYLCRLQGILIQLNNECFFDRRTFKRALQLIEGGDIAFIGTDCHGIRYRSPDLERALYALSDNLDEDTFADFFEGQEEYFI